MQLLREADAARKGQRTIESRKSRVPGGGPLQEPVQDEPRLGITWRWCARCARRQAVRTQLRCRRSCRWSAARRPLGWGAGVWEAEAGEVEEEELVFEPDDEVN